MCSFDFFELVVQIGGMIKEKTFICGMTSYLAIKTIYLKTEDSVMTLPDRGPQACQQVLEVEPQAGRIMASHDPRSHNRS